MSAVVEALKAGLLGLDRETTLEAARSAVEGGPAGAQAGVDALAEALEEVGRRFQAGDWFLGELVYSGEIAKQAMELLAPHLEATAGAGRGTLVVGTVKGDLHDLGKDIFTGYARSSGFRVVDLGTDVAADRFVAAVREHRPVALGVSCLLTTCAGGIAVVVEELREQGLRDAVKLVVGGAALTEAFAREAGADAFAADAVAGTRIVRAWSGT